MSRSDCLPGPGRLRRGLIRPSWGPDTHRPGSPMVPRGTVLACPPCYPGGLAASRQLDWTQQHRPSPNVHGVGAPDYVTRLHLGSLRATACEVARSHRGAVVRELSASGYPWHLPQATWADCQVPGPDFHRRVTRYPRHTDVARISRIFNLPPRRLDRRQTPILARESALAPSKAPSTENGGWGPGAGGWSKRDGRRLRSHSALARNDRAKENRGRGQGSRDRA